MFKAPRVFLAALLVGGSCLYTATVHGTPQDPFGKLQELVNGGSPNSQEIILGPNSGGTINLPTIEALKGELKDMSPADLAKLQLTAASGYDPESVLKLAVALQLLGKTDEAKAAYYKAIVMYPPGLETYNGLLELYEQSADRSIHIFVNGKEIGFETPPMIQKGTTLVPIRAVSEALGAQVSWDGDTRTATIVNGDTTLQLAQDDVQAFSNGKAVKLEVPAQNMNGSILVPVRLVSEQFDKDVQYVSKGNGTAIIPITSK